MKFGIRYCAALALLPLSFTVLGQSAVSRTMVDTVQALVKIRKAVEAENAPILRRIDFLMAEVRNDNGKVNHYNDSIAEASLLLSNLAPKVKSENIRVSAEVYFNKHIDKVSQDTLLAYCNPKEVRKAQEDKEAEVKIAKILAKFREKEEKRVAKGDYTNGFLPNLLRTNLDHYSASRNRLQEGIAQKNEEISEQYGRVQPVPEKFSKSEWEKRMGEEAEFPVRKERVLLAEAGLDSITYTGLMDSLFSDTEMRKYVLENMTAEGCFDGLLKDRVTFFPYPPSRIDAIEAGDDAQAYQTVVAMSERGTTVPYLFQIPDSYFCIYPQKKNSNYKVEPLLEKWALQEMPARKSQERTGVVLIWSDSTYDLSKLFTLVGEKGEWKRRTPVDVKYFSFDKCVEMTTQNGGRPDIKQLMVQEPQTLTDYFISLLLTDNEKVGIEAVPGETYRYVKTNPAFLDFEVPASELKSWFVSDNPWAEGTQALFLEYEAPVTRQVEGENTEPVAIPGVTERKCDIYRLNINLSALCKINGRDYGDCQWERIGYGVYDKEKKGYQMTPIPGILHISAPYPIEDETPQ